MLWGKVGDRLLVHEAIARSRSVWDTATLDAWMKSDAAAADTRTAEEIIGDTIAADMRRHRGH